MSSHEISTNTGEATLASSAHSAAATSGKLFQNNQGVHNRDQTHLNIHEQEPIYCAEQIKIPTELPDIVKNYTKHMIRTQPNDLIAASAEYFAKMVHLVQTTTPVSMASRRLTEMQLEGFYTKFMTRLEQEAVPKSELTAACLEIGMQEGAVEELYGLGDWTAEDRIPWIRLWSIMLASSAGSLISTLELAVKILADNKKVNPKPIVEVFTYLAERDATLSKDAEKVKTIVAEISGKKEKDVDELNAYLRENLPVVQFQPRQ